MLVGDASMLAPALAEMLDAVLLTGDGGLSSAPGVRCEINVIRS